VDEAALVSLNEDPDFFTNLGDGVWLMDNHRWAFYIWEEFRAESENKRFSLVHADYHWDGNNDFHEKSDEVEKLLSVGRAELLEFVRISALIQYDSFIAPAVIRGLFDEVHFYCKQDDGSDVGLDEPLLLKYGCTQRIHQDAGVLSAQEFSAPLIFDLCLDLFNRSDMTYEGDIWPDKEIDAFLETVMPLIKRARLITISLSFGCSGTVEDTRRLASMIIPRIMSARR